ADADRSCRSDFSHEPLPDDRKSSRLKPLPQGRLQLVGRGYVPDGSSRVAPGADEESAEPRGPTRSSFAGWVEPTPLSTAELVNPSLSRPAEMMGIAFATPILRLV